MSGGDDDASTLVQRPPLESAEDDCVFAITVTAGPDKGARLLIDGTQASRVLIGQGPACELKLTDREVSRRHASLERRPSSVRIVDLGSTNGTWVDRVRVRDAELQGDELIRIGATTLRIDRVEGRSPAPSVEADHFGRLRGASDPMRRLYPLCARIAASTMPVIVEGETGTGKEVLAEALHEEGPRAAGPFVVFDCTAVAANLMEAELFGHERGAFTGALTARKGVFEQAHGGTLLIDEIGDLELALQPKLLRAIERSEVRRIGGAAWTRVDVRVIAATRRDLDQEIAGGRFRDDLFHRLAIARIELPPLRERRGDAALLATHFWSQLGGAPEGPPAALLGRLERETWPGNVRELRNVVAREIMLGELAGPTRAPPKSQREGDFLDQLIGSGTPFPAARERVIEEFEQRWVEKLLAEHGGNVASAAAASGIGRRYFQKLRARGRG